MTEMDVINAYADNIREWCRRFGRGLEEQDRLEIAKIGLLCAIRTYQKGLSDFLPYAKECVFSALKKERIRRNRIKRLESDYSLDMPVDDADSPPVGQLYHGAGDFVNGVVFFDFMERLDESLRSTAWMLVNHYTPSEIVWILHLSREEYLWHIAQIRYAWEDYNREIA